MQVDLLDLRPDIDEDQGYIIFSEKIRKPGYSQFFSKKSLEIDGSIGIIGMGLKLMKI